MQLFALVNIICTFDTNLKANIMKQTIVILFIFGLLFNSCKNNPNVENEKVVQLIDWKIQNSNIINSSGELITKENYNDSDWYQAEIPSTVLNALVKNDVYENIYFADNLSKIPTEQFSKPWWYRTEFTIADLSSEENFNLIFEGINYRANIWLNGKLIADSSIIESPYRIFDLNISNNIQEGKNILAVEVIPPEFDDLTIGFVDWNPPAPDKNMGLWRGVKLLRTQEVVLKNVFVDSKVNTETLDEAFLKISAELVNQSDKETNVSIEGTIENIQFSKSYALKANETKLIKLSSDEIKELHINKPLLWWPNNLGEQNLYKLNIKAVVNNKVSDKKDVRFGIREIGAYKNKNGHKGFKVNGKKVLIKGAGWVDDILLANTPEKVDAQMKYAKHMNLNTIRLEGFWGNDQSIFNKADEYGILLMIGWSCHWEWEGYCNRPETEFMSITSEKDIALQSLAYRDQIIWLRNHPSVFLWTLGSDKLPVAKLEQKVSDYINEYSPNIPYIASCKGEDMGVDFHNISEISGKVAVKMLGPYGYVTPNYWYVDTTLGGAYGFNTETGPGPQIPPMESMKRMIPEKDLWPPNNDIWNYHSGRNEFQTLNRYLKAFNARYGEAKNVEEFTFKSQMSNYEAIRAMFEAFTVNKHNTTGIIQWMFNSAWPETFWQLFDWYLMPNGAFYGTKKACQPLNLIYNYKDHNIYVANNYNEAFDNLKAEIRVLNINSEEISSSTIDFNIAENISSKIFEMPEFINITTTYFVDLKLKDENDKEISTNFYWLSTKEDVLDIENSEWFITPNKSYADFTLLNEMPETKINVTHEFSGDGNEKQLTVNIKNKSDKIAFFIELQLKNVETGLSVLPIFWEDNYITLLPGESKIINAEFNTSASINELKFDYKGLNIIK